MKVYAYMVGCANGHYTLCFMCYTLYVILVNTTYIMLYHTYVQSYTVKWLLYVLKTIHWKI